MASGSTEPESDDDRQCIHCGRWYAHLGVHQHEETCRLRSYDRRLVDLSDPHARMRAPDLEAGADDLEAGDDAGDDRGDPAPEPTPVASRSSTGRMESDPTDDEVATDGGPQAVPSGWDDAGTGSDPTPAPDADDGPAVCPTCGSPDWFRADELADQLQQEGEPVPDRVREADRACAPCSTTDDGRLAETVEVYDV